jgi:small subunit ribosomal protein S1
MVEKAVGEEDSKIDEGTGSPMWKYLKEEYDYKRPKRGDILYAEVIRIDDNEIIVDIGGKTEGVVPSADLQRMGEEAIDEISVGDKVPVYVLRPESADGDVIVSLNMARTMEDWRRAEKLYEDGAVFEGAVSGHNKGGLLVYYGKIRGFIPASQVAGLGRRTRYESRMDMLAKMEGQKLMLKVIEVDRQRRRLIFSERAASREWREKRKEELLDDLQEGDIRKGRVRNLCDFGAFVDLGGADGLIHISELSWRRVKHAREVLRVGDEVEVYVLRVDRERKRIGLSLKRLKPDPWHLVEEKYEAAEIVKGIITNVVDFGAFARIEDGIEGLIHVSELSDGDFSPGDLVREGEELYVKILSIDADRQRMALSLKQAPTREEVEGDEALAEIRAAATPEEVAVAPEAEAEAEVEFVEAAETALEPAEEPPIMEEPEADVESAEAMAEAELVAAFEPEEEELIVEEITPELDETVEAAAEVEARGGS